jgi:primary-amine oxidase
MVPATAEPSTTAASHPLAPLTAAEVEAAAEIVKVQKRLPDSYRFVSISLHEPPKQAVIDWDGISELDRQAFVILYDRETKTTHETVVSLTNHSVGDFNSLSGVQPALLYEEFLAAEEVVRKDGRWQEAMRRRGVKDVSLAQLDVWPAAYLMQEDGASRRLGRALTFLRSKENEHPYARPIEGLTTLVDLDTMDVLEVEDHGVVPIPPHPGNYIPELMAEDGNRPAFKALRDDVKPLDITQPEGPSFTVDGHEVTWQKWRLNIGWTLREGLVLFDVRYDDRGELRSVIYRASLSEMVVPYGDPSPTHVRKCAFDEGEVGLGLLVSALQLGCDCLGEVRYFDGVINDQDGNALVLEHAICMHEEDVGIAWKRLDFRTGHAEVRRLRRLVISSIVNVDNYEYGFFWHLYQDGSIELEVKLTGVLSTGAYEPGTTPRYGTPVAPGLYGPNHQHFFCVRLDMNVDGLQNTVEEVNTVPVPAGKDNPYGNAWVAVATPLRTEAEAKRSVNTATARYWRITNPNRRNELGAPVAYRLEPHGNVGLFHQPGSPIRQRAKFAEHHLWVTPFSPEERYAAGDYPAQNPGPDGVARWTETNRDIDDTDLVVWYVFGSHHVARVEDWPVMPVARIGFSLRPDGFFDGNPSLDLPRPKHSCHTESEEAVHPASLVHL